MSSEPMMRVTADMTTRARALQQEHHAALSAAAAHRENGDYTSAAICEHTAQIRADMASINRQAAGVLSGTWLPTAEHVSSPSEGLGFGVGVARWAPPKGANLGELQQWRAFCDALYQVALEQKQRAGELIPAAHATTETGQLAPEDIPGPDPLTATPAEETSAQPLPTGVEPIEPDAQADCGRCREPLVRVAGVWVHELPRRRECADRQLAEPVNVAVLAEQQTEQPPFGRLIGHRVVVLLIGGHRAHGVLRATAPRLVLDPCEDGPGELELEQVVKVSPMPARADAGIWRQGPAGELLRMVPSDYPERPVNGGPAAVDGDRTDG